MERKPGMRWIAVLCVLILILMNGCKTTLTFILQKNIQPDAKTEIHIGLDDVLRR